MELCIKPVLVKDVVGFIKVGLSYIKVEGTGNGCRPTTCILTMENDLVTSLSELGIKSSKVGKTYILFPPLDDSMTSENLPFFDVEGKPLRMCVYDVHSAESVQTLNEYFDLAVKENQNKANTAMIKRLDAFRKVFTEHSLDNGKSALIERNNEVFADGGLMFEGYVYVSIQAMELSSNQLTNYLLYVDLSLVDGHTFEISLPSSIQVPGNALAKLAQRITDALHKYVRWINVQKVS
jgi:hypothetical protein